MNNTLKLKRFEKFMKTEGFKYSLEILELLFLKYQILEKSKKGCYLTAKEFLKVEIEIDFVLLKIETLFRSLRELKKD